MAISVDKSRSTDTCIRVKLSSILLLNGHFEYMYIQLNYTESALELMRVHENLW